MPKLGELHRNQLAEEARRHGVDYEGSDEKGKKAIVDALLGEGRNQQIIRGKKKGKKQ